jgi:hypothetical protein
MELVVGICMGSSIVRILSSSLFLLLTPDIVLCKANRHFRHTPPSRDWLDVRNTAHKSGLVS